MIDKVIVRAQSPVERVAQMIGRRLLEESPQRLPDLRRKVSPKLREVFIPGCVLAIQRGWVVREGDEVLALGNFERDGASWQGLQGGLGRQLDEALGRQA
jgi:hypothetical protein